MQSSDFIYKYKTEDQTVARNNLLAMAQDVGTQGAVGIGSSNSGWCYALAPLRQFLADPRFIRLLRKYKARYYYNEQVKPNEEFLKAMYGENYKTNLQWNGVSNILTTLCQCTDANGNLLPVDGPDRIYNYSFYTEVQDPKTGQPTQQLIYKYVNSPYAYLIRFVHRLFPKGKKSGSKPMYDYLSDCTAIMSESTKILSCKDTAPIYPRKPIDLKEMETVIDNKQCIVATANGNHVFNIYKDDQNKYRLLGVREEQRLPFDNLINAVTALQPEAHAPKQQYWLCEKITEMQLDQSKKAGIETYLKKHKSYLDQINNNNNPFVPGNNNFGNNNINFFPNQNNTNNNKNHNFISNNNHASNKNHFNINNGSNNQNNMNNMFNINNQQLQKMNSYINNYLQSYNSNVNLIKNHKLLTEAKEKYKAANGIKSKQVYNEIQRDTLNGYNEKLDMCKKQINENQKQMKMLDCQMKMLCNQNINLWNLYNQKIAVIKKTI